MATGHYYIDGYDIRFYESQFTINRGDISLRIQTEYDTNDTLDILVHSEYHAVIQTARSVMNIEYRDMNKEGAGVIEIDVRTEEESLWTTLLRGISKHVLHTIVCILRGCPTAEEYLVRKRGGKATRRRTLRKKG